MADAFGLASIGRSFATKSTLVVTPQMIALPRASIAVSWLGDGESGLRTVVGRGG